MLELEFVDTPVLALEVGFDVEAAELSIPQAKGFRDDVQVGGPLLPIARAGGRSGALVGVVSVRQREPGEAGLELAVVLQCVREIPSHIRAGEASLPQTVFQCRLHPHVCERPAQQLKGAHVDVQLRQRQHAAARRHLFNHSEPAIHVQLSCRSNDGKSAVRQRCRNVEGDHTAHRNENPVAAATFNHSAHFLAEGDLHPVVVRPDRAPLEARGDDVRGNLRQGGWQSRADALQVGLEQVVRQALTQGDESAPGGAAPEVRKPEIACGLTAEGIHVGPPARVDGDGAALGPDVHGRGAAHGGRRAVLHRNAGLGEVEFRVDLIEGRDIAGKEQTIVDELIRPHHPGIAARPQRDVELDVELAGTGRTHVAVEMPDQFRQSGSSR